MGVRVRRSNFVSACALACAFVCVCVPVKTAYKMCIHIRVFLNACSISVNVWMYFLEYLSLIYYSEEVPVIAWHSITFSSLPCMINSWPLCGATSCTRFGYVQAYIQVTVFIHLHNNH